MKTYENQLKSQFERVLGALLGVRWAVWVSSGSGARALCALALALASFLLSVQKPFEQHTLAAGLWFMFCGCWVLFSMLGVYWTLNSKSQTQCASAE